jgi:tRNA (uracil-5-)-methyltransferase
MFLRTFHSGSRPLLTASRTDLRRRNFHFDLFGVKSIPPLRFFEPSPHAVHVLAMAKEKRAREESKHRQPTQWKSKKRKAKDDRLEDPLLGEAERLLGTPRSESLLALGSGKKETVEGRDDDSQSEANVVKRDDFHKVELIIEEMSAKGDGLARAPDKDHVYVIPFTIPGEKVLAEVRRSPSPRFGPHSEGFLVEVLQPSPRRGAAGCKYFGTCSGCQLQMITYEEQLSFKRKTVESAFRHHSGLTPEQIPQVAETGPSPLQYSYRTKLTPHFDGPRKQDDGRKWFKELPNIGFNREGSSRVVDIESCPIGTDIVQEGFKAERARVHRTIQQYRQGATLNIRETTERETTGSAQDDPLAALPAPSNKSLKQHGPNLSLEITYPDLGIKDIKTYHTVQSSENTITEYIGTYKFTTRASSFFQNNNSILPSFLQYVRAQSAPKSNPPLKYLLDAYCGSGLFAITLAPLFSSVLGIEIDGYAVEHARLNAEANKLPHCGFVAADASNLFADVPYPPEQTVLVIDPPRKGCSEDFIRQMLRFGAQRVVYVSCNVHTQARDVGIMVRGGLDGNEVKRVGWRYEIESLKGWDFFPQTAHVEGVCVLQRIEEESK